MASIGNIVNLNATPYIVGREYIADDIILHLYQLYTVITPFTATDWTTDEPNCQKIIGSSDGFTVIENGEYTIYKYVDGTYEVITEIDLSTVTIKKRKISNTKLLIDSRILNVENYDISFLDNTPSAFSQKIIYQEDDGSYSLGIKLINYSMTDIQLTGKAIIKFKTTSDLTQPVTVDPPTETPPPAEEGGEVTA